MRVCVHVYVCVCVCVCVWFRQNTCIERCLFKVIFVAICTYRIYSTTNINFSLAWVWVLIEGGSYSRVAFINFGPILDSVIYKNLNTEDCALSNRHTIIKEAPTLQ